jgi:heme exporter protein C
MQMLLSPVVTITRYSRVIVGVLLWLLLLLSPIVLWQTISSPTDSLQGDLVRIMYIHVPSAWISLGCYTALALLSATFLVVRNVQYFLLARSCCGVGMLYTAIALITGSVWGKAAWGAWWVWDARLTSMLMLLFLYLGYKLISEQRIRNERNAVVASVYAIACLVIIPIIKFSVDFWSTLHQPSSIIRLDGPSVHLTILLPLLLSFAWHGLFTILCIILSLNAKKK